MKKFIGLLILILSFTSLFGQLGAKVQQSGIYGTWFCDFDDYQMKLILNKSGDGELDGERIRFTISGNRLIIDTEEESISYNYTLLENTLTFSGGDLEQVLSFTRANTLPSGSKPVAAVASKPTEIIGVWSTQGETLEFKPDGQCIYLGNTFTYTLSNTSITIITTQGNAQFSYSVKGNQLHLMANGQEVVYTKSGAITNTSSSSFDNVKNIDQSLVGKWCWTNTTTTNTGGSSNSECIVLQANGTYQYAAERSMDTNTNAFYGGTSSQSGDQGRWWVQGDRIYYDSQTRGQGSYRLERRNHPKTGDPMIILDGDSYVTFYQKAPWR
jgi:hypothetical protein